MLFLVGQSLRFALSLNNGSDALLKAFFYLNLKNISLFYYQSLTNKILLVFQKRSEVLKYKLLLKNPYEIYSLPS
jgi:hypothetical protein